MSWGGRCWIWIAAAVALAGCGSARTGAGTATAAAAAPSPGWQQIPLTDLDGHPVTLAKLTAGRPALVNLWAPWCERCKTELPDLDRLSRRLAGCAVIVGVAVGEDAATTTAFVRERALSYPQVVDEGFHLADALRQSRVPTTLVIDGAGAIVHVGLAVDQAAVDALESALAHTEANGHCTGAVGPPTNPRGSPAEFRGHDASADRPSTRSAEIVRKTAISWLSGIEYAPCRLT